MTTRTAYLRLAFPALLTTVLLAGCASVGDATSQSRIIEPGGVGLTASDQSATPWPAADWWTVFDDPQLSHLIEAAQGGNPSIKIAEARVRLAKQAEILAGSANGPDLALNANATRERLSENYIFPPPLGGSTVTDGRVALDFSYQFDFWGKRRANLAAAVDQTEALQAEQDSAQLILAVAVAQTYFALQRSYEDLAIAREFLSERESIVELTKMRIARGLDTRGDVDLPSAAVSSARQDIAALEGNIELGKHQLAALTGRGPEALADMTAPRARNASAAPLPSALPADLLGRRPDIVAQRLRIEAASKEISAAKAEFYPNVDLTAFFGVQAIGTGSLFEVGSRTLGAGPALHLPIFNAGSLRANLGAKYAGYDIAVEQYNQTVIDAVREVADQGTALRSIAAQRRESTEGLDSLRRAYDLSLLRYRKGLNNYIAVLNTENALLTQRRVDSQLRERELQASLGLIKALGGGYIQRATTTTRN